MKEKTMYVCDTCGRAYEYLKDCRVCEDSHRKTVRIADKMYLNGGDEYPVRVNVLFDNGKSVWFRQESPS